MSGDSPSPELKKQPSSCTQNRDPQVIYHIATENDPFKDDTYRPVFTMIYLVKMVICHSYVELPEAIFTCEHFINWRRV